jgi:hypothetical protein
MVKIDLAKFNDFNFFFSIKTNKDNMYWSCYLKAPEKKVLNNFLKCCNNQNDYDKRKNIYC